MAWLSGYSYRQKIKIDGTADGAMTNYQMLLTVHSGAGSSSGSTCYLKSHAENFPNDIRFTKEDGSTEIDYWMQDSGEPAKIWIEFDSIADGGGSPSYTYFYIYYGKAAGATASSGADTFRFFDDFPGDSLDGEKWTTVGSPVVVVSGGILTITINAAEYINTADFARPARLRLRQKDINIELQTVASFSFGSYEYVDSNYISHGVVRRRYTTNLEGLVNTNNTGGREFSSGYTPLWVYAVYDIVWTASKTELWRNDAQLTADLTTYIPSIDLPVIFGADFFPTGSYDHEMEVDWVAVLNTTATEPTWGTWGSEETLPAAGRSFGFIIG